MMTFPEFRKTKVTISGTELENIRQSGTLIPEHSFLVDHFDPWNLFDETSSVHVYDNDGCHSPIIVEELGDSNDAKTLYIDTLGEEFQFNSGIHGWLGADLKAYEMRCEQRNEVPNYESEV